MQRRSFIKGIAGSVAALPLAARAQRGEETRRIGVFMSTTADDPDTKARLIAFHQDLERFGWVEGRNLRVDYRFGAGKAEQYQALAQELVAVLPDVIVAVSPPIVTALHQATQSIPIVFTNVSDPVRLGFIASMARPGGNVTGLMQYEAGIAGKWLAMLKEIAPRLSQAALLANSKTTDFDYFAHASEAAAYSLGIKLIPAPVQNVSEIERAIDTLAAAPDCGLVVPPDATTLLHRNDIVAAAGRNRLPAVYAFRLFVLAGGLMSYGADQVDMFRQAASYVNRILRGAKPADLPVQEPVKYQTVVNLKAAQAIGLDVPASLLVRADEVIE